MKDKTGPNHPADDLLDLYLGDLSWSSRTGHDRHKGLIEEELEKLEKTYPKRGPSPPSDEFALFASDLLLEQLRKAVLANDARKAATSALGLLVNFLELDPQARSRRKSTETVMKSAAAEAAKKRKAAIPRNERWQKDAEEIWSKNPQLTKSKVADIIVKRHKAGKVNTIRQYIKKPDN